jgi:ATP-dependent 26S proteasome regulatory subunit
LTQNMSNEQSKVRNTEDYVHRFTTLSQAAIGVVLTRSREPFRAIEALREYAAATDNEFRVWTLSHGWATYNNQDPEAEPTYDEMADPIQALKQVNATQGGFNERGVYVMMYPHKPMAQAFLMIQIMKEYCRLFSESHKRLVLLMPPSYKIPEELEDDLVVLDFEAPSYAELNENYGRLVTNIASAEKQPVFTDEQINRILSAGAGMTAHEFDNAVARALIEHKAELPNPNIDSFVKVIADVKTEVVKRSDVLEVMEPGDINEIGGLENLKSWIRKRRHCFGQKARDFGVDTPKGIALIGPPGTGKSLAAKAIASELGITALKFDVGRVFNSLVGESESRVRSALKMVDAMAPCVLMIDEADKAFAGQAGGGSGGDSGVGMRVLGAILTWMQETTAPVFVVVTANRTRNLPSEFIRKGRLDEVFSVTTPHEDERLEIIKIHIRKRKQDPALIEGLAEAVSNSSGYVPAELEAAVKDAILEAYVGGTPLTGSMIVDQLKVMTPLREAFAEDFAEMETWAKNNARPASLDPGSTKEAPRTRTRARQTATGAGRAVNLDG